MSEKPDLDNALQLHADLGDELERLRSGDWVQRSELEAANQEIFEQQGWISTLQGELATSKSRAAPVPLIFRDRRDIDWVLASVHPDVAEQIKARMPSPTKEGE